MATTKYVKKTGKKQSNENEEESITRRCRRTPNRKFKGNKKTVNKTNDREKDRDKAKRKDRKRNETYKNLAITENNIIQQSVCVGTEV